MNWINVEPIEFRNRVKSFELPREIAEHICPIAINKWSDKFLSDLFKELQKRNQIPGSAILRFVCFLGSRDAIQFVAVDKSFEEVEPGFEAPSVLLPLSKDAKTK